MALCSSLLFAILGIVLGSASASGQQAPPRYKLTVGQEIHYSYKSEFTHHGVALVERYTWILWVIANNGDGSWRIIARQTSKHPRLIQGHPEEGYEVVSMMDFNLFPEGRITSNHSIGIEANPRWVFQRLPDGAGDKAWQCDLPGGPQIQYTALPDRNTSTDFVFRREWISAAGSPHETRYVLIDHFDVQRGLIVSEARDVTQKDIAGKATGGLTLESVEMKPGWFIAHIASESATYFKAAEDYERRVTEAYVHADNDASKSGPKIDAMMKQATHDLREARSKLTLPMFTDLVDKTLAQHDQTVSDINQEAQRIAGMVDKPAADWTLKDLAGASHSLADYRGKIVLLDFWYSGCGWCIKEMPQLKQVAEDFKNDPVVLLGMNTDQNDADAASTVKSMGLNYTTLHAVGIPEKYGVEGFPTLVLIDPKGVVRAMHVGYSAAVRKELDQEVRDLLPRKSNPPVN